MLPLRRPSLKAAASRFEAIASWASTQRACLSPCLSPWPSPWPSNSPRRHPCSGTALAFSDHGGWLVRQRPGRVREGSCHWRATDGRGRAAAPAGLLLPTTHLPGSLAVTPSGPIRNALPCLGSHAARTSQSEKGRSRLTLSIFISPPFFCRLLSILPG